MSKESVTKIIDQSIRDFFDTFAQRELDEVLDRQDKEELFAFFEKYFKEAPSFGDYIYLYIYQTTDLKHSGKKYYEIDSRIYYNDYISRSFQNRLGKVRATLNPDSKETLGTKKDILSGARKPVRDDVFLFAFGLGMDVETVSLILRKCLMEGDFNMKNYREVIYYWCLSNNLPYEEMLKWLDYYKKLDPERENIRKRTISIEKTETLILTDKVKYQLREEEDVKAYLASLKKAEDKSLIRRSEKRTFKQLLYAFPKEFEEAGAEFEPIDKNGKSEKEVLLEDRQYSEELSLEKRLLVLEKIRNLSYEKNKEELLSDELLCCLFDGLNYTKKRIHNRFYSATPVSRTEILASEFIVYMVGLLDDEREEQRSRKGNTVITFKHRRADWIDFAETASATLEDLGMEGFYVRNPFDLFLVFCMMHQDPFAYFMASWRKGRECRG